MDGERFTKNKGLRTLVQDQMLISKWLMKSLAGDDSGTSGLGEMDGAKYGKMIKANKGTYVKASCKMGRNKPTKIT